ncbi:hypothetical protein AYO38_10515 [bacterium SCGC AG-212-C10]|nr:hypothetical protein AYO38_10515 [bacterium SCGC AG-212-C10]
MPRDLLVLRQRLAPAIDGGERITGVLPFTVGHSSDTYLLQGLDRVLRTRPDGEGLLPPYDMARQHAILAAVAAAEGGPPVPRVYELCEDEAVIGAPFYIMERRPGEAFERHDQPSWFSEGAPALRDSMCTQWIDAMVAVHRLPAETVPGPLTTPFDDIKRWYDIARHLDAPTALLELQEDLLRNPPPRSGEPTVVHGDLKQGNCLWHEGKLSALLDWELAGQGEPMTDLGYVIAHFRDGDDEPAQWSLCPPGWWSREQVVRAWEAGTGRQAAGLRRHEFAAMAKIATIILLGAGLHARGGTSDPRIARWDAKLIDYMERIAYRRARS